MKIRIWHASRDAYHCAFRMIRLLSAATELTLELERLRILDMYLLFPPLLHRTSMTQELKAKFRELHIPTPEEIFERLPSIASVYQELRVFQNAAASYLAAKNILRRESLQKGIAEFVNENLPSDIRSGADLRNSAQESLVKFLVNDFSKIPLTGTESIYRRAGLPARQILS
jgi:ABC-three component (ABC-3C) system Middle Component 5